MSWFGGGGKKDADTSSARTMNIDEFDGAAAHDNRNSSMNGGGGGMPAGSFEQELMQEQQKAVIQAVMFKLTESSFDSCVPKPSSSLSYGEKSCISAVVGKYLDVSELVVGRIQGAQQR
jgi:import inner membrane translocase subunit TIM13